jgi:hypothetical protein
LHNTSRVYSSTASAALTWSWGCLQKGFRVCCWWEGGGRQGCLREP